MTLKVKEYAFSFKLNNFISFARGISFRGFAGQFKSRTIAVDYRLSLSEMILAGRYDSISAAITAERFPLDGKGNVEYEIKCFTFNGAAVPEKVHETIWGTDDVHPWLPARIEHLLSFGAKYPEEQMRFPIVASASIAQVSGKRGVPCLLHRRTDRCLDFLWWCHAWNSRYRFLAIRPHSS